MIPLVDFKQLSAGEKDSEILRWVDWIGVVMKTLGFFCNIVVYIVIQ